MNVEAKDTMELKFFNAVSKVWTKDLKTILLLPQYIHCINLCIQEVTRSCNVLKLLNLNIIFSNLVRDSNTV